MVVKRGSSPTLSLAETLELEDLEATVSRGLESFLAVGRALMAIKGQKLYRAEYPSFESYLKGRWNLSRSRGYQLVSAAGTAENLGMSTMVDIPEQQLRPLARLKDPDLQREAWAKAQATAPEGGMSGKHIKAIVDRMEIAVSRRDQQQTASEVLFLLEPYLVEYDPEAVRPWSVVSHNGAIDIGLCLSQEAPLDLVVALGRNYLDESIDVGEADQAGERITECNSFVVWRGNEVAAVATLNPEDPTTMVVRYFL